MSGEETKKCPKCLASNPVFASYCMKCGEKLETNGGEEEKKERGRREQYVNYLYNGRLFESALTEDGVAAFLTYDEVEGFKILKEVSAVDEAGESVVIQPAAPKSLPYRQYLVSGDLNKPINLADLWLEAVNFIKRRVVAPSEYIKLLAFDVFLTYFQESFEAIHYLYLVGDTESGKTRVLNVLGMLCFRPLETVDMPAADIYEYLGRDPNLCRGIILEDEAEDIVSDADKRRIWKAGYKRGALVPRIITVERTGVRKQQFYNCYCFKAAAAEKLPEGGKAKGLLERCIILNMLHGVPERKDLTEEDWVEAQRIRFELLRARLKFFGKIKVEEEYYIPVKFDGEEKIVRLKGRDRELFAPILIVGALIGRLEEAKQVVSYFLSQRLKIKKQALEYYMAKALLKIVEEGRVKGVVGDYIEFTPIEGFEALKDVVEGEFDDTGEAIKSPLLEGKITRDYFGKRLKDVFKGERLVSKRDDKSIRVWRIKVENVKAVLSKYEWLEEVGEKSEIQPSLPVSGEIQAPIEKATGIQAQATPSTPLPVITSGGSTPVTPKLPPVKESRLMIKEEKEGGALPITSRGVEEVAFRKIEPLPEKETQTPVAFTEAPKILSLEKIIEKRELLLKWCETYNLAFFIFYRRLLLGEIKRFGLKEDVEPLASQMLVDEKLREEIKVEMEKYKGLPTVFKPYIRCERKDDGVYTYFGVSTDDNVLTRFINLLNEYLEGEKKRRQLHETAPIKASILTSSHFPMDKCYFCGSQPIIAQLTFERDEWVLVCGKCLDDFKSRFNFPIEDVREWRQKRKKMS